MDEALRIIKLMYAQDGPSFVGKYYSISEVECFPKPIQKPYPPIMVGGTGETLKTVARHTDIYNRLDDAELKEIYLNGDILCPNKTKLQEHNCTCDLVHGAKLSAILNS